MNKLDLICFILWFVAALLLDSMHAIATSAVLFVIGFMIASKPEKEEKP